METIYMVLEFVFQMFILAVFLIATVTVTGVSIYASHIISVYFLTSAGYSHIVFTCVLYIFFWLLVIFLLDRFFQRF